MSSTVKSAMQTKRLKSIPQLTQRPRTPPQTRAQIQAQVQAQIQPPPIPQPLPPASTPAWLRSRPKELKNRINRPTSAAMKKKIESAKARQIKKAAERLPEKPYLDEIIVFDERVILNEEGVPAYILQADADLADTVYFTPSFFPDEKDLYKIKLAKTVFSKVFFPGSTFSLENPAPPCETTESSILMEGLQNHLYVLRKNLPQGYDEIYSMNVRNIFERAKKIKLVLEKFKDDNTICSRYDVDFNTNERVNIKGYGKPIANIDRERVQNLLRQFSFLILQAMHPIPGHEDKVGNITPEFLLDALEQNAISKGEMDEYIAEYAESSKADVPDIIVHTLEATESQDDVYALMLESELAKLIAYIKEIILNGLKDEILKRNFIKHTESQEGLPLKDEIVGILKWIMDEYTKQKKIADDNMGTLVSNKSAQDTLRGSLTENQAKILELESKLLAAQTQLNTEINKHAANPSPTRQQIIAQQKPTNEVKTENLELKNQLVQRQGEKEELQTKLDALKQSSQTATNNLLAAQQTAGTLGNALNVASNPNDISLLKKVEEIANAVKEKRDAQLDKDSPFNELYNNFKSSTQNDISSVCYLTYFVKFFINNIFKGDVELYTDLNKIIDEYLNTDNDIDRVMENLKYILESVEGDKTRGVGCYVLNKEPIKLLDDLYKKMNENPEINERCMKALNYLFKNYNRSDVYYIPKSAISESDNNFMQSFANMFYIRPFKMSGNNINIYDLSGNIINDTKISTDKIFKNSSLPYATIFIFYILFSRKYLLVREDKQGCPLPKSLKSESLKITKGKVTYAATVKN